MSLWSSLWGNRRFESISLQQRVHCEPGADEFLAPATTRRANCLRRVCDHVVDITPELDIAPQLATEWQWLDGNEGLVLPVSRSS
jgi:hypothetical protein